MNLRALPLLLSLLAVTSAYALGYVGNEDFWWYLASGEQILERGAIPEQDPFLYTSAERATWVTSGQEAHTWVTHSWLWTVLLAWLDRQLGLEGVALFSALCVATLTALIFTRARLDRFGLANAALAGLALYESAGRFTPRTDLVSGLLLVVYLALLDRRRALGWRTLALLAALQWLWSNLHGGYPLGLFVAFAYGLGDWLQSRRAEPAAPSGRARSSAPLLALGPLLLLASLATPGLGPERLRAAAAFLRELGASTRGAAANPLIEWQPTYAAGLDATAWMHLALCVVGVLSFAAARRPWRLARLVVFTGLALLGVSANRFVSLFALTTALVALGNLAELAPALAQRLAALRRPWLRALHVVTAAAGCALLLATALALWISRDALDGDASRPRHRFTATRPEFVAPGAAAYIRTHQLRGPIFNEIVLGGYLIDALYPEHQLFIDTRNLSAPLLARYRAAIADAEVWRTLERRRRFQTVVLSNLSFTPMRLRRLLARDPAWRLAFADPQAAIFVRSGAAPAPPPEIAPFGRWGEGRAPFLPPSAPGPQRALRHFGLSLLLEYLRALAELEQPAALEQVADAALAQEPGDAMLLAFRGYSRLRLGRAAEAADDYAEALRRAPDDVAMRVGLVRALLRGGRVEEARAQLEEVRAREPKHPALPGLMERIQPSGPIRHAPAP